MYFCHSLALVANCNAIMTADQQDKDKGRNISFYFHELEKTE